MTVSTVSTVSVVVFLCTYIYGYIEILNSENATSTYILFNWCYIPEMFYSVILRMGPSWAVILLARHFDSLYLAYIIEVVQNRKFLPVWKSIKFKHA